MDQTQAFVRPYASELTAFSRELLSQRWPVKVSSDVQALARDMANFTGDVETLPSINVFGVSQWLSSFARDENLSGVSANIVRSDLGLPLAKS
jgi:hypothetical protein